MVPLRSSVAAAIFFEFDLDDAGKIHRTQQAARGLSQRGRIDGLDFSLLALDDPLAALRKFRFFSLRSFIALVDESPTASPQAIHRLRRLVSNSPAPSQGWPRQPWSAWTAA